MVRAPRARLMQAQAIVARPMPMFMCPPIMALAHQAPLMPGVITAARRARAAMCPRIMARAPRARLMRAQAIAASSLLARCLFQA